MKILALIIAIGFSACSHAPPRCTRMVKNCKALGENLWECDDVALANYDGPVSNVTCGDSQ